MSGTVVHIRKVSKKLAFFDIEHPEHTKNIKSENKESEIGSLTRTTVVFKSWECGDSLVLATRSKDKIHVGDELHSVDILKIKIHSVLKDTVLSNFGPLQILT